MYKFGLLNHLMGKETVDALLRALYEQDGEFREIHRNYLSALEGLDMTEGEKKKLDAAVQLKCSSLLFYCGIRGLKMNYDHFRDPMAPNCTWPQVDFEDYLQLGQAYEMPLYSAASEYCSQAVKQLPEEACEAVLNYGITLEVYGTKLAHYYGYLMGNELLRHCVPGYRADPGLELRYRSMLERYFGGPLRQDRWEGIVDLRNWASIPQANASDADVAALWAEICK